jgi:DNA-binding response OmpR family regulator
MSSGIRDQRQIGETSSPRVYCAGNLTLDLDSRHACLAGERLVLTHQEFEVLTLLVSWLNQVVSYKTICECLWGSAGFREMKRLGVAISNLRGKLHGLSPHTISTVRSRGYGMVIGHRVT